MIYQRSRSTGIFIEMLLVLPLSFFMMGCLDHAPRNHPLDPLGEAYDNTGRIQGTITTQYAPFEGIPDVRITLTPGGIFNITDSEGSFLITDLEEGTYVLEASRQDYAGIIDTLQIQAGDVVPVSYPLNALPVVDSLRLASIAVSRWWPPPLDFRELEIEVSASDQDGVTDIVKVWFEVKALGYADSLDATGTNGVYRLRVREDNLPFPLASFQGLDHIVYLRDRSGLVNASSAATIHRIIEQTPQALRPTDLELISSDQIVLAWEPVLLNYPFTYRIDVIRVDNNLRNVYLSQAGISSEVLSQTIPAPREPGEYFWTVSIVDQFGNQSRSREAGFQIL